MRLLIVAFVTLFALGMTSSVSADVVDTLRAGSPMVESGLKDARPAETTATCLSTDFVARGSMVTVMQLSAGVITCVEERDTSPRSMPLMVFSNEGQ